MSKNFSEEIRVKGEHVMEKIRELVKEGNIRSISIKDKDGNVIMTIPMTVGVIGVLFAPTLAAIGAATALLTECTISVERRV